MWQISWLNWWHIDTVNGRLLTVKINAGESQATEREIRTREIKISFGMSTSVSGFGLNSDSKRNLNKIKCRSPIQGSLAQRRSFCAQTFTGWIPPIINSFEIGAALRHRR